MGFDVYLNDLIQQQDQENYKKDVFIFHAGMILAQKLLAKIALSCVFTAYFYGNGIIKTKVIAKV
jgi:hypothetical protein